MKNLNLCLLSACLVITFAAAQTPAELVGTWQTESNGVIYIQMINADGSYTFEAVGQNYLEQGTWQFDGTNYSQQWQDPRTGEAMNETYTIEFLSADSFAQSGGNLQDQVFTFTRANVQATPDEPAPDQPTTNPLNTPSNPDPASTQNAPSLTPDQLAQMGIDPNTMLIPDEFYCYLSEFSDNYSEYSVLTILPNQRYSFDGVEGDYEIVDIASLIEIAWRSGPFASEDSYGFASYRDYGQTISVHEIPYGEDTYAMDCYQRGPANDQLQLELAFRDVQPGSYACINTDTGNSAPTLEILGERIYRIDGVDGEYQIDLMTNPEDDIVAIDYLSGAWAGGYGSAIANEETGMREVDVTTDAEDYTCKLLGAAMQEIQYGTGVAPAPPAGAGGLEGFYANWEPDMSGMGLCAGGICWDYLYFFPNGYVYKERPDGLLEQIDCTRTQPNGAPLCDTYTLEGNTIYFSDGERKSLVQTADGLEINGKNYSRIPSFDGLVLKGVFEASSFTQAAPGQGGVAIEKTITFYPDGTFMREGFAGGSAPNVTVTSEGSSQGTYQVQGNSITFNFEDGQVSTEFFFVIPGEDPSNPGAIRIGGWDFLAQ